MKVNFITRAEALERYLTKEKQAAMEACRQAGVAYIDPTERWDRLRNYEIEHRLEDATGGQIWIVTEWCPFNGIHCRYMRVAPIRDLRDQLRRHEEYVAGGGYVAEFVFREIRAAIAQRSLRGLAEDALYTNGEPFYIENAKEV